VDNLLGTILDAGTGIVWEDDRQVVTATVQKFLWDGEPWRAHVRVTVLADTGFEPKPPRLPTKRTRLWKRERGGADERTTRTANRATSGVPDAGKGPSRVSKGQVQ
jgi:hypothetical protein